MNDLYGFGTLDKDGAKSRSGVVEIVKQYIEVVAIVTFDDTEGFGFQRGTPPLDELLRRRKWIQDFHVLDGLV